MLTEDHSIRDGLTRVNVRKKEIPRSSYRPLCGKMQGCEEDTERKRGKLKGKKEEKGEGEVPLRTIYNFKDKGLLGSS